jgi:dihydrofolate reductase
MGKLIVFMNLTLDGVMQAPGRREEDTRGDFQYGGWGQPYAAMSEAGEYTPNFGGLLLGRRTYDDFSSFWPKQTDSPFKDMLNNMQKWVASRTLKEPLSWVNTTLLKSDTGKAVIALKEKLDKDIVIMGSGDLIRSLMKENLIDRYVLMIHPLVLGSGIHLFTDNSIYSTLRLVGTKGTSKGVVVAVYEPEA